MIDLKGRHVIVTGGGRGIGAACAVLFARAGADVVIGYRSRRADAESVALECVSHGVRATAIAADLSQRGGADALCIAATAQFGAVDIMVANAGVWPTTPEPIATMSDARWHDTAAQNYESMFQCARAAARTVSDGGRIIFVSSTAGQRGEAYHADYAAAKGAMISLTKSMAVELAPRQVTVNAVAPGWVDTDAILPVVFGEERTRVSANIPLGRIASPADIAGPIVFLASPLARHITGEILNINGGSVLCG
ncbi:MAG TPA: SDR family oxidoreductase [Gemmatimonadaceae bacterium]|nr:SDR family oxidoreductase [Gemmatimonadaceae bacterium]